MDLITKGPANNKDNLLELRTLYEGDLILTIESNYV